MIRGEVFAENEADFRTLRAFIWLLLREVGAQWLRDLLEERPRDTLGSQIAMTFSPLTSVANQLVSIGARPLSGHFDGAPGADGAAQARNAWHLLRKRNESLSSDDAFDFAFVLRDADGKAEERRQGLIQAMRGARASVPCSKPQLLTGLAITEREGWVLACFVPRDQRERDALTREQQRSGLTLDADLHQLVNADRSHPRDNKRVLEALLGTTPDEHEERIIQSSFETVARRGATTGLCRALGDFALWLLCCHAELVDRASVDRWFDRADFDPLS